MGRDRPDHSQDARATRARGQGVCLCGEPVPDPLRRPAALGATGLRASSAANIAHRGIQLVLTGTHLQASGPLDPRPWANTDVISPRPEHVATGTALMRSRSNMPWQVDDSGGIDDSLLPSTEAPKAIRTDPPAPMSCDADFGARPCRGSVCDGHHDPAQQPRRQHRHAWLPCAISMPHSRHAAESRRRASTGAAPEPCASIRVVLAAHAAAQGGGAVGQGRLCAAKEQLRTHIHRRHAGHGSVAAGAARSQAPRFTQFVICTAFTSAGLANPKNHLSANLMKLRKAQARQWHVGAGGLTRNRTKSAAGNRKKRRSSTRRRGRHPSTTTCPPSSRNCCSRRV